MKNEEEFSVFVLHSAFIISHFAFML